jgi:hypothetical protein
MFLIRATRPSDVWADSAYRGDEIEEKLAARGLKSRIGHDVKIKDNRLFACDLEARALLKASLEN